MQYPTVSYQNANTLSANKKIGYKTNVNSLNNLHTQFEE